jgi:uncharacterized membrane protein YhaH (DUF805 family)
VLFRSYVVFTQADRYQERINKEWAGDLDAALKKLLPDLYSAIRETGSQCALVSAFEKEPCDGDVLPNVGENVGDLSTLITTIDAFLIKNKVVLAQEKLKNEERQLTVEERAGFVANVRDSGSGNDITAVPPPFPTPIPAPSAALKPYEFNFCGVFKKAGVWEGRATRKEFWLFMLWSCIIFSILFVVGTLCAMDSKKLADAVGGPIAAFTLWWCVVGISVTVRRLHDVGYSGGWFWLNLIPCTGTSILFVLLCKDGTPTANRYGPNPKNPNPLP